METATIETVNTVSEQDKQLFKKVKKVHLSTLLPKYNFPTGITHAVVDEHKNILNYCSEGYSLVENSKILLPIEKKFNENKVNFIRQASVYSESQFHVSYLLKSNKKKVLGQLYPKLTIVNSYDGKVKFRHEFGWFRLVCLNGLTRPHGTGVVQVNKHSSDLTEESLAFLIMDILDETNAFIDQSKSDIERFERLNSKKVTKKLVEEVGKQLKLSDKVIDSASARYLLETGQTDKAFTYVDFDGNLKTSDKADSSLFTLYNAINYAIYNNNPKEPMDVKAKKDSLLLEAVEARLN